MYGLPPDFDPSIFIGRELQQVSFTVNTIHLAFDGEIGITLESTFEIQTDAKSEPVRQAPPVQVSTLMSLIGRQVCAARSDGNGALMIEYEGGGRLTFIDDSREYESYHIWIRGKEIIV